MTVERRIKRTTARFLSIVILATGLVAGGCSLQKFTVKQTASVLGEGAVAMDRESDPQFAREAFPASLKTFESLLVHVPENEQLLELLAEGYFSYAFGFIEMDLARAQVELAPEERIEDLTERAVLHYMRARDYGFRLLDMPALEKAAKKPNLEKVKKLLKNVEKDQVPGLFWASYGWGSAVNLAQQDPNMVAALPVVEAMMRRVVELDPSFYDYGAHLFFGVYYASRPKIAGGNPEKAKEHFDKAMKKAGDRNLIIPVLYGRYYGAQTQDQEFFNKMMEKVKTTDAEKYPDKRLNNEIAKDRMEFWTKHADELFY